MFPIKVQNKVIRNDFFSLVLFVNTQNRLLLGIQRPDIDGTKNKSKKAKSFPDIGANY